MPATDQTRQSRSFDLLAMLALPLLRRADVFLALEQYAQPRVLDLGCGNGARITGLRDYGRSKMIGLDRDPALVHSAQEHYPHANYVVGDAEHLPFKAATIDALISFSVLQYVDWRRVAGECRDVLRVGGKAVFHENLAGSPIAKVYRRLNRALHRNLGTFMTPRNHMAWDDLGHFTTVFGRSQATPYHLTTPILFPLVSIKKHRLRRIRESIGTVAYPLLYALDRVSLRALPGLARRSWMVAVHATRTK